MMSPKNLLITPDLYRNFIKTLIEKDIEKRRKNLLHIAKGHPQFKEAQFYLGELELEAGNLDKSREYFNKVTGLKNPLLHKDGFMGQSFTKLARIDLLQNKNESGIKNSTTALKLSTSNAKAMSIRSLHYLALEKNEAALADANNAIKADSKNSTYHWNKAKVLSNANKGGALDSLQKAIELGFRDFDLVRKWSPLEEELKTPKGRSLITPVIHAIYKPGVFKDDIVIFNKNRFILDDFRSFIEVKYLKKKEWYTLEMAASKTKFSIGDKIEFKNKFSMSKSSQCKISITFTSKQNPEKVETLILYNHDGKKEHKFGWEVDVSEAWNDILKSNDKDVLNKAIEKLKRAADKGVEGSHNIISGIAHALHKLGDKEKAVELQEKAIKMMKEKLPENVYDITVVPYRKALEKFKEFKKKLE